MRALLRAGLRHDEIGVITPYNAQVEVLRAELEEERQVPSAVGEGSALEVGTVDGFQGREKEAIVISLVRSNPRREVGLPLVGSWNPPAPSPAPSSYHPHPHPITPTLTHTLTPSRPRGRWASSPRTDA